MTSLAHIHQHVSGQHACLVPASQFTIEELTHAYNQTRVDYMVPMPMNTARLVSYIQTYDIDMDHSWVAVDDDEILGLAMLGVRPGRTWITRLGVLPARRRHGTGEALMRKLQEETHSLGRQSSILEVIKGNQPAHTLLKKVGYEDTRELLVLRRPPGLPLIQRSGQAAWLEKADILNLLSGCPIRQAWTNEIASYSNAEDAQGLVIELGLGGRGWLAFRRQKFLLSHFVFHTEIGDPDLVANALISHLYNRFPNVDTYIENIPENNSQISSLKRLGFIEVFRRIEMKWRA